MDNIIISQARMSILSIEGKLEVVTLYNKTLRYIKDFLSEYDELYTKYPNESARIVRCNLVAPAQTPSINEDLQRECSALCEMYPYLTSAFFNC